MKIDRNLVKNPFWAISAEDSILMLRSSHQGISESDAFERRKIFGENKIVSQKRFVRLRLLLKQFESPLIYILVAAGLVTLFLDDIKDTVFIFVAVAINVSLGFYQEGRAERALEALNNYLEKRIKVIRAGRARAIRVEELVPGDMVNVSIGDSIPADCRIIQSSNLLMDETILTGESLPVEKGVKTIGLQAGLGDKKSMIFSGTSVVEGVGSAIVVATGRDTELGTIASLIAGIKDEATPLQKSIDSFASKLTFVISLLSLLIFTIGWFYGYSVLEMFTMSVAIAVAAVPEDLTIAMTVILAMGVERLAKKKGVVRRLLSAETLGDISIILTDKTGTLTEAKMELSHVEVPPMSSCTDLLDCQSEILRSAILCTDAYIENPEAPVSEWKIEGKPLDVALIRGGARDFGLKEFDLRKNIVTVDRLPFNSQNKFSEVRIREGASETMLMIGAPEVILKRCSNFYWNSKGVISDEERAAILKEVHRKALGGYRIISVASSRMYMGNILLRDPVRKGISQVIGEIEGEGIKTIIVTGDHVGTAISVAQELGMRIDKASVIEQRELDLLSDEELRPKLSGVKIFARIDPRSKVRIAKLLQDDGYVVAMTGDGVNDAPALKQADIGIALGSGSGVARESSDMILLDDSFHIIVSAIDEGRRILQNIQKVLVFCLADLFDEVLLVAGSILLNLPIPLTAAQILWVNFITDSLPTISLSYEDEAVGGKTIRRRIGRKSIFNSEVKFLIWVVGILTSILLFVLHYLLLNSGAEEVLAKTFIFASFGIYTLFLIFSVRSLDKNIWEYNPFSNRFTNFSSAVGIILMLLAVYNSSLQKLLGTTSLPPTWLFAVIAVSLCCVAMVELGKFVFIRRRRASYVVV